MSKSGTRMDYEEDEASAFMPRVEAATPGTWLFACAAFLAYAAVAVSGPLQIFLSVRG